MVSTFRVLCDVPVSVSASLDRDEVADELDTQLNKLITQVGNEVESWGAGSPVDRRGLLIVLLVEASPEE